MEIILKEDIKGLGYKDDIVRVKPGHGRNHLIPKGLGILATPSNRKVLKEKLKQVVHKLQQLKEEAVALSENIGELCLTIETKAGETGKIFGSITHLQVADALKEKGFHIERKNISFESIKTLGEYRVVLDLHKEVKHEIKINVIAV